MRSLATILAALLVSACSSTPLVVDLPAYAYHASPETKLARKAIANIDIRSTADDGNSVYGGLGADTTVQLKPAVPTKQTVELDLRQFFAEVLSTDRASTRSITATIRRAESYWIWSAAAKTPILGLAFANADTEFGMNVRVSIEVEEGGKVISSYLFDEKITIQDKAATREAIQASYKRLVAEYRKRLYAELEPESVSQLPARSIFV